MIAKPERTRSTAQQNMKNTEPPPCEQLLRIKTINNNRTTALELTAAQTTGVLNAVYRYQIFALDSVVAKSQKSFSSHGCFLTVAVYKPFC